MRFWYESDMRASKSQTNLRYTQSCQNLRLSHSKIESYSLCRMGIPCKFCDDFCDLYQNKLWVICNNLIQFAHLSSASGPSNDVIKMAAIVLLMYTYKTSHS